MSGLAASPLGALIGVLMGAFGGGGSVIAIPILVYVVGQDVRAAQATALVIVIAAALIALASFRRDDVIRLRAGIAFGLAAGASAFAGSLLSRALDPDLLLLAFTPLMLTGAAAMVSDAARRPAQFRPWRFGVERGVAARVVAYGLMVGWIIGLFGVGGGFVIVPVLVLGLRFSMPEAVATALLVICISSSVALLDRVEAGDVEWGVAIPFALAAAAGSLAGRRWADRIGGESQRQAFALLIVTVAAYTAIRSGLALLG